MQKLLSHFRHSRLLNTLFLSNIFISFHYALIVYINSPFLANFFSNTQISSLYIIGSLADTILLLNSSKILKKIGNYRFVTSAIGVELVAILLLVLSPSPFLAACGFLLHLVTISQLLFNLDILVESVSTDESQTGSIRASYLTLTNLTIVIAPSVVAILLVQNTYSYVYALSSLFLIPLYFYIKRFKNVPESPVLPIRIKETLMTYMRDKDLLNIFSVAFLLQLFYAFMTIYTPLYLLQYIGFSWSQVGVIFTIMLLPFILFEVPVGDLADKKYGEQEFMTVGFIIMGLATLCMSFITAKSFWIWAAILFITRIGASFVEVTAESFFFKHVNQEKTDIISFFRVARPLSYIIAPLLATLCLQFIPFQYMFIILGAIMVYGTHYSLALHDTK